MQNLTDLRIAVVTHEHFKGSGQELKDYLLRKKIKRVFYIAHRFFYATDSISYMEDYEFGRQVNRKESVKLPSYEFLMYLRDAFYALRFFVFRNDHFDLFVGADSFNTLFGLLLKKLGRVDKVAFLTIDYVMHNRFKQRFLNWLYVKMDRLAFWGSDYTWNVSDRMSRQRIVELGDKAKEKIQLVVPIGVPSGDAEKVKVDRKNNVIVYSGGLTPEFGLELIVESMPKLIKLFPNIELRIIGGGVLEEKLKTMVRDLGVGKNVNIVGFINTTTDRERWLRLLKESTISLATYEDNETTYKRYSDVTKPKDYMACGLPIITTSVIPLSEEITKHNLGRVVGYTTDSFVRGVSAILGNETERKKIMENVYNYSKNMTWDAVFDKVFLEMGITAR